MKWSLRIVAGGALLVVVACMASTAWAQLKGDYRIELMNGRCVEGEVKELADGSYEVTTKFGAIVTVRKNQVRAIRRLTETGRPGEVASRTDQDDGRYSLRRAIADEEINAILSGIIAEIDESVSSVSPSDMMAELPVDEDSLEEMKRLAGSGGKVLLKPHFAFVYTSSDEAARKLASRLEGVWRWNVKFMKTMLKLPMKRPEHKLEIFYFGKYEEFLAYSRATGGGTSPGILGYYRPDNNRSCFFDLATYPRAAMWLEMAKNKNLPYKQRQIARNKINQWVEFNNLAVIQHETGHHIHFNNGTFPREVFIDTRSFDSLPRWLVEGTTMLFEVPPTSVGASLGVVNHGRLHEWRMLYAHRKLSPQQLKEFILDNSVFLRGGGQTYSLGWAMVHYFWKKDRQGYREYMRTIGSREPGVDVSYTQREKEFEDCFGKIDEKWIDDWYEYLEDLQLAKSVLPPNLP